MKVRFFVFCIIILFLAGLSACASVPRDAVSDSSKSTVPPISGGAGGNSSSASAGPDADGAREGQTASARPYEYYEVPLDASALWFEENNAWVIDRDGHTISEDRQFDVLYDVLSGEPQCLLLTKNEIVGRDEYAGPVTLRSSSLYDLDGDMLYDWGAYTYRAGFGDFVVRQESVEMNSFEYIQAGEQYSSELWDYKQDRSLMANIWRAERLSEGKVLLFDQQDCPLAIVDENARVLEQNTVKEYFNVRVWNGYMIAATGTYEEENIREVLLSPKFAALRTNDIIQTGAAERALLYDYYPDTFGMQTERSGIVTLEGKEIFEIPSGQGCLYFDDELIVLSSGAADGAALYQVVRMADGMALGEKFEILGYVSDYQNGIRSESFAGYKDGVLYLLDRNGKTFARKSIPDVKNIYYIGDEFIAVSTEKISGYYENSVFDMDLNEIIAEVTYTHIDKASSWDAGGTVYYDVFVCSRHTGAEGVILKDIVDLSGEILISGLNEVYSAGPDRLVVRKGFEAGLMDWSGEWIAKRSIFSELRD